MAKKKSTKARKPARSKQAKAAAAAEPTDRRSAFRLRDDEVEPALQSGAQAGLLEDYFGPDLFDELQQLSQEAATRTVRGGPRVVILPGIMGSKLGKERFVFDDILWVDPVEIAIGRLDGLAWPANPGKAEPVGVILFAYLKLKLRLRIAGYDATFFPFDWRQSLDRLGQQLAAALRAEKPPVHLVAHSMGGLVARAAISALGDEVDQHVRRLVMLGTPNYGSFAVPQALRATAGMVRKVAAVDLRHSADELVETVFSTFPGLYQMLPWKEKYPDLDFLNMAVWPQKGLRPRQEILDKVAAVRKALAPASEHFYLIAGVNKETVVGARVDGDQFVYTSSMEGDGTVPLRFAELPGAKTYYAEESHGSLPNNTVVEDAVMDILARGATDLLPDHWEPAQRRTTRTVTEDRMLEVPPFDGRRGSDLSQRELRQVLEEFVSAEGAERTRPAATPLPQDLNQLTVGRRTQHRLEIRLALGSITEADAQAYVFGVFRDLEPTGPLAEVDRRLDGAVTEFHMRRMFSGNVGEVFILPTGRHLVRADSVVLVGLGPFDRYDDQVQKLTGEVVIRTLARTKVDDLATVMLGAEAGKSPMSSVQNLLEGLVRGLLDADPERRFRSITVCETDSERYAAIKQALYRLASTRLFEDVEVMFDEIELPAPAPAIPGARRIGVARNPVYLTVAREDEEEVVNLRASVLAPGRKATVVTEVQSFEAADLDKKLNEIERSSFNIGNLDRYGTELAELVLPKGILQILETIRDERLVVVHDSFASRIPWETLCIGQRFPALEQGMDRRYIAANLSIVKWLESRQVGNILDVLLIVNPTEDLPGAEEEGRYIQQELSNYPAVKTDVLYTSDATKAAVLDAFRSGKYDVVHYAGHASFNEADPPRSGIYCHDYKVLSGAELTGLTHLPALMFFNACESGRIRSPQDNRALAPRGKPQKDLSMPKRIQRTAGLAESFLRGGLANFLGTYWPVGDAAAKGFAGVFYTSLLEGSSIGEALLAGRQKLKAEGELDWADYIHYGSASFVVKERN